MVRSTCLHMLCVWHSWVFTLVKCRSTCIGKILWGLGVWIHMFIPWGFLCKSLSVRSLHIKKCISLSLYLALCMSLNLLACISIRLHSPIETPVLSYFIHCTYFSYIFSFLKTLGNKGNLNLLKRGFHGFRWNIIDLIFIWYCTALCMLDLVNLCIFMFMQIWKLTKEIISDFAWSFWALKVKYFAFIYLHMQFPIDWE